MPAIHKQEVTENRQNTERLQSLAYDRQPAGPQLYHQREQPCCSTFLFTRDTTALMQTSLGYLYSGALLGLAGQVPSNKNLKQLSISRTGCWNAR